MKYRSHPIERWTSINPGLGARKAAAGRRWVLAAISLLSLLVLFFHVHRVGAQDPDVIDREYQIKAAYLYNFAKYVEWPSDYVPVTQDNKQVFVIGVVGENPFQGALKTIASTKVVDEKPIVIRTVQGPEDLGTCHILYFPAGTPPQTVKSILEKTASTPTLTVGENDAFLEAGGVLSFYLEANKVRFAIDPEKATQSKLKISSKLLNIARISQAKN